MLGKWKVLSLPPWARPSAFTCRYINYIHVPGMLCCFVVIILAVYLYFPTLWTSFDQWFILITGKTSTFQKEQYHFPIVKNSGWSSLEAFSCKGGCNVSQGRAAPGRVNSTPTGPSRTQNAPPRRSPRKENAFLLPPCLCLRVKKMFSPSCSYCAALASTPQSARRSLTSKSFLAGIFVHLISPQKTPFLNHCCSFTTSYLLWVVRSCHQNPVFPERNLKY